MVTHNISKTMMVLSSIISVAILLQLALKYCSALSFAAKIASENLDCELQPTEDESTRLLSGALFGFAQLPNVIGWFASEFVPVNRTTLKIRPINDKRYDYLIVGGIATEPINRRLAVARDRGMDVLDFVKKTILAELAFPACLGTLSELQFDAASGNLYGLAYTTLANDGVSCDGKERELLIQIDYLANKLRVVAEPNACTIFVGVSTFDYVKRHFYFQGQECGQSVGGASANMTAPGATHLYRIDVSDDAKSALGQAPVTKLPAPEPAVSLIKWSQTAAAPGGTFFVMSHVNLPSFDFSLGTLDPDTGKVSKLSDKAHRAQSLILNAACTVDGPNNVMLIQNVDSTFDVLSLTTGAKVDDVAVTFDVADTTGAAATTSAAGATTTSTSTTTAAMTTSSVDNGNGTAPATTLTFTATTTANNGGVTTAPLGSLATVGSIQLAPTCICCSRRAGNNTQSIMKKRNIAPLNEDQVKACASTPAPTAAASSVRVGVAMVVAMVAMAMNW